MIEIGFTGSRQGMSIAQHRAVVKIMLSQHMAKQHYGIERYVQWHHGICVGADKQLHELALIFGFNIYGHPPEIETYMAECTGFNQLADPKPFISRNHDIVDASSKLIATPKQYEEFVRSGTWATIRYARKIGIEVIIINPAGHINDT